MGGVGLNILQVEWHETSIGGAGYSQSGYIIMLERTKEGSENDGEIGAASWAEG